MNITLQELRALSDNLHLEPDDRPAWLKAMPYSMENPSHYHRLLFEIARRYRPEYVIEIGIDKAGSTMALAAGNPEGTLLSIDIDRGACENAKRLALQHGLKNLQIVNDESSRNLKLIEVIGKKANLLFVDGAHDFVHAYSDYQQYRNFVCEGGIILLDDIHEGREMEAAWGHVVDPKIELPKAHHSGYGACKVDHAIPCKTLETLLGEGKGKF